jgi:hypothetical protein
MTRKIVTVNLFVIDKTKFKAYLFQICKFGKSFETDETRFDNTKQKDA